MARKARRHNHFTLLTCNTPGTLIEIISTFEKSCGPLKSVSAKHVVGTDGLVIQIIDDKLSDQKAESIAHQLRTMHLVRSVSIEQVIRAV